MCLSLSHSTWHSRGAGITGDAVNYSRELSQVERAQQKQITSLPEEVTVAERSLSKQVESKWDSLVPGSFS